MLWWDLSVHLMGLSAEVERCTHSEMQLVHLKKGHLPEATFVYILQYFLMEDNCIIVLFAKMQLITLIN